MPFLLGLIKDILDLDTYKKLKLQKARVDNYKAIVIEIPIDEDAVDKPLLTKIEHAILYLTNLAKWWIDWQDKEIRTIFKDQSIKHILHG